MTKTDNAPSQSLTVLFVGPNNIKGAKLAGDFLAMKLNKGDAVAIIDGQPGAFNAIQRHEGFESAMKAAGMNVVTSQRYVAWGKMGALGFEPRTKGL